MLGHMSCEQHGKHETKHLSAFVITHSNTTLTPLHFCSPGRESLGEVNNLLSGSLSANSLISCKRLAEALDVRHDSSIVGTQRARGIVARQAVSSGHRDLSCDEQIIHIGTLDDLAKWEALAKPECLLGVQAFKTLEDILVRLLTDRDSILVTHGNYAKTQSVVHRT